jgi:hypothetical protein
MATKRQGKSSSNIDYTKRIAPRLDTICSGSSETKVELPSAAKNLSALVQKSTLQTRDRYDWQKGKMVTERADILTNARHSINQGKICTVSNNRRDNKQPKSKRGMNTLCGGSPSYY